MVPDFDSGFIPLLYLVVEGLLFAVVLQRITNYAEAGLNAFFLYEVKRLLKAGNRICREVVKLYDYNWFKPVRRRRHRARENRQRQRRTKDKRKYFF